MNHSDMWRGSRHADRAKEIASVTHGVSDYFGTVAEDRSYSVSWTPMGDNMAMTQLGQKLITLNADILDSVETPFTGDFVDDLMGFASHEAGHTFLIAGVEYRLNSLGVPRNPLRDNLSNIIQDVAIDYGPMAAWNPTIGELTRGVRQSWQERQRETIAEHWSDTSQPLDAHELANLWGCAYLFDCVEVLTKIPGRETAAALAIRLSAQADKIKTSKLPINNGQPICDEVAEVTRSCYLLLNQYMPQPAIPPQSGGDKGSDGQSGKGSGKGSGKAGEGEGSGAGGSEKSDDEKSESEGSGEKKEPEAPKQKAEAGSSKEEPGEKAEGSGNAGGGSSGESTEGEGSRSKEASSGAGGTGAGGITRCPSQTMTKSADEQGHVKRLSEAEQELWDAVVAEIERLEAESMLRQGVKRADAKRLLAKYLDPKVVASIERSWRRLANDPSRRRRITQGKIDRRMIVLAEGRDDIFNSRQLAKLDGTLVLALDLSGSTSGSTHLIKQVAASVYVALARTDLATHIYSYGDPNVAQMASPYMIADFDNFYSSGGTPMGNALDTIVRDVRPKGRSVIINVTDGIGDNMQTVAKVAKDAKGKGWTIINIGVGQAHMLPLDAIAKKHGWPKAIHLDDYRQLPKAIEGIVTGLLKEKR